jgi:hypothetical protein
MECDCLEKIQEESLRWIETHTDLLTNAPQFWNKIDSKLFLLQNPTLVKFCLDKKLSIREVAVLVTTHDESLHVDEGPVVAKLNIPLKNTKDTFTEWYEVPELNDIKSVESPFGNPFLDLQNVDLAKCKKINEVELISPLIFNSSIPHKVRFESTLKEPRVVLSCMFFKEPKHYLEEEIALA